MMNIVCIYLYMYMQYIKPSTLRGKEQKLTATANSSHSHSGDRYSQNLLQSNTTSLSCDLLSSRREVGGLLCLHRAGERRRGAVREAGTKRETLKMWWSRLLGCLRHHCRRRERERPRVSHDVHCQKHASTIHSCPYMYITSNIHTVYIAS